MKKLYKGGENIETINHLLDGETVIVGGKGNSMTPKLKIGYPRRTVSKKNRYIDITYKHSNVIIKPHPTIHSMWEYVYTYTNRQPNFSKSTRYVETHKSIIPYNHVNAKLTLFEQRKGEFDVG